MRGCSAIIYFKVLFDTKGDLLTNSMRWFGLLRYGLIARKKIETNFK